jgi:hypothetical protein
MSEYPEVPLIKTWNIGLKEELKIEIMDQSYDEKPISVELPISVAGVALPKCAVGETSTWLGGIINRIGNRTPLMNRTESREFKRFVHKWCVANIKPLNPDTDISPEKWLVTAPYARRRKRQLINNFRKHERSGLTYEQTKISGFPKDEPYVDIKYPRMINSRVDYFKVYSGPLFDLISKELFSNGWFIKSIPVDLRPKALLDRLHGEGNTYFSTDYTSFEAHFIAQVMGCCEFVLYRFMVSQHSQAKIQMEEIIKVLKGKSSMHFKNGKVSVNATRMSGEMNTSLGNGFTNLMVYLYLAWKKKAGEVRGYVEGDDGIFVCEKPELAPNTEDFRRLGWNIKIDSNKDIYRASFCGCVFDPIELVNVTDPRKVLASFGWSSKRYVQASEKTLLKLLRAKALSYAYQYNGVPILSAFFRSILRTTEGVKLDSKIFENFDPYKRDILSRAYNNMPAERFPGPSTRSIVEELYGITITDQIKIEKSIPDKISLYTRVMFPTITFPILWSETSQRYIVLAGTKHQLFGGLPSREYLESLLKACPQLEAQFARSKQIVYF